MPGSPLASAREAQRKKQIADAVAAKIEDLENEESQAGVVVEEDGLSVQNEVRYAMSRQKSRGNKSFY